MSIGTASGGIGTIPDIARVTVNLPWKLWDFVQSIAKNDSVSRTEALRRCIATEAWRRRAIEDGAEVVLRRRKEDGTYDYSLVEWSY